MSFNKSISKFLATITIAACIVPNFNDCISGMEVEDKFPEAVVDDLCKEFVKLVKTQNDYSVLCIVLDALNFITMQTDPSDYYNVSGTTLNSYINKIKTLMKYPNSEQFFGTERLVKLEIKIRYLVSMKLRSNYNDKKYNDLIDFIFEQISKKIPETDMATEAKLDKLDDLLARVYSKFRSKWKNIADGKIKIRNIVSGMQRMRDGELCTICYNDQLPADTYLPCCGQVLHTTCLNSWKQTGKNCCPFCRKQL